MLIVFSFFTFGLVHAFEMDHLATVSLFAATGPRLREALRFAVSWAVGHGMSLTCFGSALYLIKLSLSTRLQQGFETAVGVAMLVLGLLVLWRKSRRRHSHTHGARTHTPFYMGLLHGTAGTGAFLAEAFIIAGATAHYGLLLSTALAFSGGVFMAMCAYTLILGRTFEFVPQRYLPWLSRVAGAWTATVGALWIWRGV